MKIHLFPLSGRVVGIIAEDDRIALWESNAILFYTPKASAASLPPRLLRLLPAGATVAGWDSHPLKDRAFARRTKYSI